MRSSGSSVQRVERPAAGQHKVLAGSWLGLREARAGALPSQGIRLGFPEEVTAEWTLEG